jgi:tetratricopeptide (TPR) repeat protein
MPTQEIKELRKQGQLDEAMKMALDEYNAIEDKDSNDAMWARRNLSWVYYDYIKKASGEGNVKQFKEWFDQLLELNNPPEEKMLWNSLCYPFFMLMSAKSKVLGAMQTDELCDEMFSLAKQLHPDVPGKEYSILFKAFHKFRDNWNGYRAFCDWWNFDNFQPNDFECEDMSNGHKAGTSLVESAYIGYAKVLLENHDIEAIKTFIQRIDALIESHPQMMWTEYYKGKMLLAVGDDGEETIRLIKDVVKKKVSEFWAWELMAEVVDGDKQLACLMRAARSKTKDKFLVGVRQDLAEKLIERGDYFSAKKLINIVVKTREENGYSIPREIQDWQSKPWYNEEHEPQPPIDYMKITDDLLLGDMPEHLAVVVNVNHEKPIATVAYGFQKNGFFGYGRFLKKVKVGDVLKVRFKENGDAKLNMMSVAPSDDVPDDSFYKTGVEGKVTQNRAGTAHFLKTETMGFIFIPPKMFEQSQLAVNDNASITAVLSYNRRLEKWDWTCLKVD